MLVITAFTARGALFQGVFRNPAVQNAVEPGFKPTTLNLLRQWQVQHTEDVAQKKNQANIGYIKS